MNKINNNEAMNNMGIINKANNNENTGSYIRAEIRIKMVTISIVIIIIISCTSSFGLKWTFLKTDLMQDLLISWMKPQLHTVHYN